MTTTLTASTTAQLNQDIATADAATSGGFIIDLQGNITETAQLHAIDLQPGVPLTIDGSNGSGGVHRLDGAGSHGFLVDAGSVTIENLSLSNAVLAGGSSSATVTLANDIFSRNVTIAHGLTVDEIAQVTFNSSTVTNQAGSTYDVGVIGSAFAAGPVVGYRTSSIRVRWPRPASLRRIPRRQQYLRQRNRHRHAFGHGGQQSSFLWRAQQLLRDLCGRRHVRLLDRQHRRSRHHQHDQRRLHHC
jgi:hypothetical protein